MASAAGESWAVGGAGLTDARAVPKKGNDTTVPKQSLEGTLSKQEARLEAEGDTLQASGERGPRRAARLTRRRRVVLSVVEVSRRSTCRS